MKFESALILKKMKIEGFGLCLLVALLPSCLLLIASGSILVDADSYTHGVKMGLGIGNIILGIISVIGVCCSGCYCLSGSDAYDSKFVF